MIDLIIYGKQNCSKCTLLKRRVHQLADPAIFNVVVREIDSEDGKNLGLFCLEGDLNPNNIPILLAQYKNERLPECEELPVNKRLAGGILTDYDDGDGIIKPEEISVFLAWCKKHVDDQGS